MCRRQPNLGKLLLVLFNDELDNGNYEKLTSLMEERPSLKYIRICQSSQPEINEAEAHIIIFAQWCKPPQM